MIPATSARPYDTWRRRAALILDILILIYAAALILFLTGVEDLGFATISRGEKPLLILLIAIPLRLTLGGESWLLELPRRGLRDPAAIRAATIDRVPPAILDPLFALLVIRLGSIFVAFAVSLTVGVVFGLLPARRAASLNPTEALRYE